MASLRMRSAKVQKSHGGLKTISLTVIIDPYGMAALWAAFSCSYIINGEHSAGFRIFLFGTGADHGHGGNGCIDCFTNLSVDH